LFVNTIKGASQFHVQNILNSFKSLSNSITGEANQGESQDFPFVTVKNFEILGEATRRQSGFEVLAYTPRVTQEQGSDWLIYANKNQGWIEESKEVLKASRDKSFQVSNYLPGQIMPFIYEYDEFIIRPADNPVMFPVWQMSPPPFTPGFVNFDTTQKGSYLESMYEVVEVIREAIFTQVEDISRLAGVGVSFEDHEAYHASLVDWDNDVNASAYAHPHSVLLEPVFRKLTDDTSEIVGIISGVLPWDRYLVDLLPEGVRGITCVLKNTCDQAFTYALNGNEVSYVRCPLLQQSIMSLTFHTALFRRSILEREISTRRRTAIWRSSFHSRLSSGLSLRRTLPVIACTPSTSFPPSSSKRTIDPTFRRF
jgi:hypothetical protein